MDAQFFLLFEPLYPNHDFAFRRCLVQRTAFARAYRCVPSRPRMLRLYLGAHIYTLSLSNPEKDRVYIDTHHQDKQYLPRQHRTNASLFLLYLALVELVASAGKMQAAAFLSKLIETVPYQIHTILTDDGIQFTNRKRDSQALEHIFTCTCQQHGALTAVSPKSTIHGQTGRWSA